MKAPSIDVLLAGGRLERVPPDQDAAASMLQESQRHLLSVVQIMDLDPTGAYSLLYDGARKAVAAHMLASGYRAAPNRPGAHAAVVAYAAVALEDGRLADIVRGFDRMRRTRHRVEYESAIIGSAQIETDLKRAHEIVDLVELAWPS